MRDDTPECTICGMDMPKGGAVGDICYFCIKKVVKYYNDEVEESDKNES